MRAAFLFVGRTEMGTDCGLVLRGIRNLPDTPAPWTSMEHDCHAFETEHRLSEELVSPARTGEVGHAARPLT